MQIDYDILPEILLQASAFFIVYYLIVHKYIYSVFDPLFTYVFSLSFSSILVVYLFSDQTVYLYHFYISQFCFFVGFIISNYIIKNNNNIVANVDPPILFYDYKILRVTFYILFIIYVSGNIVTLYTTGFALLNEDPTLARVENFTKGFAIIYIMNIGIGSFLITSILFFVISESKRIDYIFLIVIILLMSVEGSKSSLLRVLMAFVLLLNHSLFEYKKNVIKKLKLLAPFGFMCALGVAFTVLSKENDGISQTFLAFIRRLIYGTDSMLTFYLPVNEQYFDRFRFWEYPSHFFNQIFAFLRIVPNEEALGNIMVANAFPDRLGTIVGPNTPFNIEGQIYFGYYGAFIYSVLVGGCYGSIRQYFFSNKYYSSFWFILIYCVCLQANALPGEVTYFVIQVFYTCFFVIPVYTVVSLVFTGKLVMRKPQFK